MSCFNCLSIAFVNSLNLAKLYRDCKCGFSDVGFDIFVDVDVTMFAFVVLYCRNIASFGS